MSNSTPTDPQRLSELKVDIVTPIYTGIVLDAAKLAAGKGYLPKQKALANRMNHGQSDSAEWTIPSETTPSNTHGTSTAPVSDMIAPSGQPWGGTHYPLYLLESNIKKKYEKELDAANFIFEEQKGFFNIYYDKLNAKISHNGFLLITASIALKKSGNSTFLLSDAVRAIKLFWEEAYSDPEDSIEDLVTKITARLTKSISTSKFSLLYEDYEKHFSEYFRKFKNTAIWVHPVYYLSDLEASKRDLYSEILSDKISVEKNSENTDNGTFGYIGAPYSCIKLDDGTNLIQDLSFEVIQDTSVFDAALEHVHRMHYIYTEKVCQNSEGRTVPELQELSKGIVTLIQMSSQIEAQFSQYSQSLKPAAVPTWKAIQEHWGLEARRDDNRNKLGELERLFNRIMNITTQKQQRQLNQVIFSLSTLTLISLILTVFGVYGNADFEWPIANYNWLWITAPIVLTGVIIAMVWRELFPPYSNKKKHRAARRRPTLDNSM